MHTSIFDIHFDVDPEIPEDLAHPSSLLHARSHATLSHSHHNHTTTFNSHSQAGSKNSRTHPRSHSRQGVGHSRSGLFCGTTGNVSVDLALDLTIPFPDGEDMCPNLDLDAGGKQVNHAPEEDLGEMEISLDLNVEMERTGARNIEDDHGTFGVASVRSLRKTSSTYTDQSLRSIVGPVEVGQGAHVSSPEADNDADVEEELRISSGRTHVHGWIERVLGVQSGY